MSGSPADPPELSGGNPSPDVDELLGWIRLLAEDVGPRRPTSESERHAARAVVDRLRPRGVSGRLEDFDGYSTFALPFVLLLGTAAAPGLLPVRMRSRRIALAALAAGMLATEGSLTRTPLSDLLARRASQNVVATVEPSSRAERTLCLMAHLDSSRSGLLFDPRYVGWLGRWITLNSVLVAAAPLAEPFAASSRPVRAALALARAVMAGGIGLLVERELRGQEVAGANDNASGCAVAAALACEAAANPPASTRVVLCLTGCEESGTLGARAFLDSHDTSGWLFLNFDNVGSGGTLRYLRREGVITHWEADREMIEVAAAVEVRRPDLRLAAEDSPAGLTYDASPVLAAGGRALTLSIQDGSIPNLHWPTDTFANVEPDGVRRALEAGREIVAAIDSGAADPAAS